MIFLGKIPLHQALLCTGLHKTGHTRVFTTTLAGNIPGITFLTPPMVYGPNIIRNTETVFKTYKTPT